MFDYESEINTHGNPLPEIRGRRAFPLTVEDVELKAHERKYISLGISVDPPEEYYVHLTPSSAACKHYGIEFAGWHIGVVNDYISDDSILAFPVVAVRDTFIPKGTCICRLHFERYEPPLELEQVEHLDGSTCDGDTRLYSLCYGLRDE